MMNREKRVKKFSKEDLVVGELYVLRRKGLGSYLDYNGKKSSARYYLNKPMVYLCSSIDKSVIYIGAMAYKSTDNLFEQYHFLLKGKELIIPGGCLHFIKRVRM